MTERRIRLASLTHTQVGVLLILANKRELRLSHSGTCDGIQGRTFELMAELGLIRITPRRTVVLTPAGFALADRAITLSREIVAAIQGISDRTFLPVQPLDEQSELGAVARMTEERKPAKPIKRLSGYRHWRETV